LAIGLVVLKPLGEQTQYASGEERLAETVLDVKS
jgi:hypothetical protein